VDEELHWLRANLPELIAAATTAPSAPTDAPADEATAPMPQNQTPPIANDVQMD
jgi:hypothetical protein